MGAQDPSQPIPNNTHIIATDQILLPIDPREDMETATKKYVDDAIAAAIAALSNS